MQITAVKDILILVAFVLGVLILGAYGVTESLIRLGYALGEHNCNHGFPWGQVIIGAILVVPISLGTATAQKIVESVASRFGKDTGP